MTSYHNHDNFIDEGNKLLLQQESINNHSQSKYTDDVPQPTLSPTKDRYRKICEYGVEDGGGKGCSTMNDGEYEGPLHSSSQEQFFTQMTSEVLTQNAEWSQLDSSQMEEEECTATTTTPKQNFGTSSPPPPQPWGRFMPCSSTSGGKIVQLFPRPPHYKGGNTNSQGDTGTALSTLFMTDHNNEHPNEFLRTIQPHDLFNVHWIGRSAKCDIQATNPSILSAPLSSRNTNSSSVSTVDKKIHARQEWCYGMISNRHCKIYCTVDALAYPDVDNNSTPTTYDHIASKLSSMQVWIEDCSGNGTTINGSTLLLKGDKRLLHSGDEICLVQKQTLQKKVVSRTELQTLLNEYSYVFVNCVNNINDNYSSSVSKSMATPVINNNFAPFDSTLSSSVSRTKRKAAVDVRATKSTRIRYSNEPPPQHQEQFPIAPLNEHDPEHVVVQQYHRKPRNSISFGIIEKLHYKTSSIEVQQEVQQQNRRISPRRQLQRRIQQDYDVRDVLGSGTMGEVRRAIHRRTGQAVAVKIIPMKRQRSLNHMSTTIEIEMEASILRKLDHPYIVKLMDVYIGPTAVYLVMELVHGGDLFDRIVQKGRYSEIDARRVMRRLLAAVHYLHESSGYGIVHRDLKPENIMLSSTKSDIEVKLTDFGVAKQDGDLKTFCGTPQYFAPEVLRRRHTVKGSGRYGKQADMWSIGVILYVLLTGTPPFDVDDNPNVNLSSQSNGESHHLDFPSDISPAAQDMVRQLLQHDPKKRASILSACTHEWILQDDGDTHVHPLEDPKLQDVVGSAVRNMEHSVVETTLQSNTIKKEDTISVVAPLLEKTFTIDSPRPDDDLQVLLPSTEKTKKLSTSAENFSFQKNFYNSTNTLSPDGIEKENTHDHLPTPLLPPFTKTPTFQPENHPTASKYVHYGTTNPITPATELHISMDKVLAPVLAASNNDSSGTMLITTGKPIRNNIKSKTDVNGDDEILSRFSENTESVGSFSTANTYEMAVPTIKKETTSSNGVKIVQDRRQKERKKPLLSRRPRKRSLCNASPTSNSLLKTAASINSKNSTKKGKKTLSHSIRQDQQKHIHIEPETSPNAVGPSSSGKICQGKKGAPTTTPNNCGVGIVGGGGGKQLTLNNWFKKHN